MKPRIYVLFVLDLDGECKFIKNKQYSYYRNSYVLGCHLGWVNKRLCIQKVAAKNNYFFNNYNPNRYT